ncbi:DUF885 domain-containing protein, partial [Brevundimonas sp.]
MKSLLLTACAVSAVLGLSAPALAQQAPVAQAAQSNAAARLKALYDAEWDYNQARYGIQKKADGTNTPRISLGLIDPASQQARIDYVQDLLTQLETIPLAELSNEQRIDAAVFRTNLEHVLIDGRARQWEMPFNSDSNFWTYLDRASDLRTAEDYRAYISRMRDIPRYFGQNMVNMRAGLARGFSVPQITLEGRESSISNFITDTAEANSFYRPFERMPSNMPASEQAQLRAEALAAINEAVIPAYRTLLTFYLDEYKPQTRTALAARDLPDGPAYYESQVRKYTTLELTGEQIHQIGLSEVARIQAEMRQTMKDAAFTGSFEEFLTFLRTDPQFYAKTPDELLMVSAWVAKRTDGQIAKLIGNLPRRPYTIIPVPEALAPFYTAGRGGLGSCQMNTYNLPSRPLYNIPALTLHECAPGHSFQAALAEEQAQGPAFRRYTY